MRTPYYNHILDELCSKFGEGIVDKLVGKHGCKRIYIAFTPQPHLLDLLGVEAAGWLTEQFAGQFVDVPSKKHVEHTRSILARNRDILASTETVSALAVKHQVSQRWVRAIKANWRDPRTS